MTFNPNNWPIRLSPSGPEIQDSESGAPLTLGPGSIGIVLRAQGTSGGSGSVGTAAAEPILGLESIPANMPVGYHYDVKAVLTIASPGSAALIVAEPLQCLVEYSTDGGTTWLPFPDHPRMYAPINVDGGMRALVYQEIDIDWTEGTATINRLRVLTYAAGGTGALHVQTGLCTLRVEQYIL